MYRDRLRRVEPGAGADRAALAVRRPVDRRAPAPHSLRRRRALLSRPRVLADAPLAERPASSTDVGHRPAARPRDRGLAGVPPCPGRRPGQGVPTRADAGPPPLARVPLPGAHARRRRPGRDLAPVGVRDGQLAALGRRPRAHLAGPRSDSSLRAGRPGLRRRGAAPNRRRVRPLRVPGQALSRLGIRLEADSPGEPVRSLRRALQLAARAVESGSRRHRACPGDRSGALRSLGGANRRRNRRQTLG